METKAIQRECISNIIDILKTSTQSEKENNLRKIKEELEFKITFSEDSVLRKLKRILKKIDREIEETTSIKDQHTVGNKEALEGTNIPVRKMSAKFESRLESRLESSIKRKILT